MPTQLTSMRNAWGTLPKRAQVAILAVTVLTVLVLFLVLRTATSTEWTPVTQELSADKIGQAETILEEAGIEHQTTATGTALEVPRDAHGKAAAALMTGGIAAKGNNVSCSKMFGDNGSFVADTTAKHAVKLETCMEGQVANTLENMDGVSKATVDATLSEQELFTDDQSAAKASVVLDTDGTPLAAKAVRGMQELVANSFPDLQVTNVSITDETGASIASGGENGEGGRANKLAVEAEKNRQIETELTKVIENIVGPKNAVVSSNVELDMDEIKREVIDNKPAKENGEQLAAVEEYAKEILKGEGAAGVQGVAGTAPNTVDPDNRIVEPDSTGVTEETDNYASDKGSIKYANNQIAELINVAQGTVTRFRIAVVVDDQVDEAAATAVNNAVQAWMGGNAQDSFSFSQAPLATAQPVAAPDTSKAGEIAGYVKWALLGLGLIGIAFVLRRALTQRTAELLAPADDLLMLEPGDFSPIPIAELEAALAAGQPTADRKARLDMQRKVEQIAETKPNDVANELRRWMHHADTAYTPTRNG
jgi:flagellar M-ring protein FliF